MVLSDIKRYLKIYAYLLKFAFIRSTTYRVSFAVELAVELGYDLAFLLFFSVLYSNIKELGGWNYNEMLFLVGMNTFTSEIFVGAIFVFGLWDLPTKVRNGDVDLVLLKPLNALFTLSLGSPYTTSFLAAISGICLMAYSLPQLHIMINITNVVSATIILICGFLICYSIIVTISSLTFKYVNAKSIPRFADKLIFEFQSYPHQVYQGIFRLLFVFIVPGVFIGSIPASAFIRKVEPNYLIIAPILAGCFLFVMTRFWNKMLKSYSSASS